MKLTKSHIGKKVTHPDFIGEPEPWIEVVNVTSIGFVARDPNAYNKKDELSFYPYYLYEKKLSLYRRKKKVL